MVSLIPLFFFFSWTTNPSQTVIGIIHIGHKSLSIIIGPYMSPAMMNWFLIGTLIEDFVEMRNLGLRIRETMWIRSSLIGFKCFSVLQNVATIYPGKTHSKTVQIRSMQICSNCKIWPKKELHTLCNNRRKFVKNEAFLPRLLDANLQHAVLDQLL